MSTAIVFNTIVVGIAVVIVDDIVVVVGIVVVDIVVVVVGGVVDGVGVVCGGCMWGDCGLAVAVRQCSVTVRPVLWTYMLI